MLSPPPLEFELVIADKEFSSEEEFSGRADAEAEATAAAAAAAAAAATVDEGDEVLDGPPPFESPSRCKLDGC